MRLNDQFGMVVAEQGGSDPDVGAPPHLTGDYCQSLVQKVCNPTRYVGNTRTQATGPLMHHH